jgi:hypothetical protein
LASEADAADWARKEPDEHALVVERIVAPEVRAKKILNKAINELTAGSNGMTNRVRQNRNRSFPHSRPTSTRSIDVAKPA